jgi:hypothetical protein
MGRVTRAPAEVLVTTADLTADAGTSVVFLSSATSAGKDNRVNPHSVPAIGLDASPRTLSRRRPAAGDPPTPRCRCEVRAVAATRRPAGGRRW